MYPFRLGTTSYIVEADLLTNARYLAGKVQDMELVLFDLPDGQSNLPTAATTAALREVGLAHGLSYTVHLPLDLTLGPTGDEAHISLRQAQKVIECTRALEPWAYVAHLDGRAIRDPHTPPTAVAQWRTHTRRALELVAGWVGTAERLAVENVETYPPDFLDPVLAGLAVSRCVDIGHLWLDGHDPLPHLTAALPRTRVIHLHGINGRDHESLAHMPTAVLRPILELLGRYPYTGVLTLEVFGQADFESSLLQLAMSKEQ